MDSKHDPEIENSRGKLLASFRGSPDLVFVRSWGNLGDELICAGTRRLLAGLDYREVSIRDLQDTTGHTALISGGGAWCKPFHDLASFLPTIEARFRSVIVLPSTFDTAEERVRKALQKTNALVFAREMASYQAIRGLCRADVAHDCAFFFGYGEYERSGRGVLNAFRSDAESTGKPVPEGNIDISVACSSLDEWLWTMSKHAVVRTDRAHVMIAAAMLGKRVEYGTSAYHKVPAIAEYSLRRYPVTRIGEVSPPCRAEPNRGILVPVSSFANFLAERSERSEVIVIDDLESHDFERQRCEDDVVVVANAISSLQRCPERIAALKKMSQEVGKTILADDIDSFSDTGAVEAFLKRHDFAVEFFGFANVLNKKAATVAVISPSQRRPASHAPDAFRVIAVMSSYNEEDVIVPVVEQLQRDKIDVYLIDNWSTDNTYQKAESLLGRGLIGLERFPPDAPSSTYDWKDLLRRKEELCQKLKADWFIHHDADELRESPWQGVGLRDAIYHADREGYNAVSFTVLHFYPVDNGYQPGSSFSDYFRYCEFSKHPADRRRIQAWKATTVRVALSESGGHSADFDGRRVFPYNFLLRHYPIRSQLHGEKKVFRERLLRYNRAEKQGGWHDHYDKFAQGTCFLKNPRTLIDCNAEFDSDYLIERLSGVGAVLPEVEELKRLSAEAAKHEAALRALNARLAERDRSLQAASARIAAMTGSRTWKIATLFHRVRTLLAPPNSRRARTLRRLKNAIARP
jgi:glycosyltransferase involved in cell wall biosynthesis/exopolysaccharide biosynthesis predicted pyruvyltransferase EpsI